MTSMMAIVIAAARKPMAWGMAAVAEASGI
jgi:hypothetical protein